MKSPIDYEMLKIHYIKFEPFVHKVIGHCGRLADNPGGISREPAEADLCFQNLDTGDRTSLAAIVNPLGIC